MLRSLFAVIVAVLVGLGAARFVEGAGAGFHVDAASPVAPAQTALPETASRAPEANALEADTLEARPSRRRLSVREGVWLTASWTLGAFVAAAAALLLGRRWAPLGWLAAATVFFNAIITLIGVVAPWPVWPGAGLGCLAAGWGAAKLLRARVDYPARARSAELFE